MTVRGNAIYHCRGKNKGKLFRRYRSHKAALRAHRAITANRRKR